MQQLNLPDEMKVTINFDGKDIPVSAKLFKPLVYQEGNFICVVLGPDPIEGVYGCRPTAEEALKDWDRHLKDRINNLNKDDEVTQFVMDKLSGPLDEIK
ncbi:MAG: hypothetical protein ABI675_30990 [Chitinophagaceae bacterium]